MKILRIIVDKIPNACGECPFYYCKLPNKMTSKGITSDDLLKKYITTRHKECPLEEEVNK